MTVSESDRPHDAERSALTPNPRPRRRALVAGARVLMSSASGTRRTIRLSIVALLPISIARTDVGWRRGPRLLRMPRRRSTPASITALRATRLWRSCGQRSRSSALRFEASKTASGKIRRPVLFGENGRPIVAYEVDCFHPGLGIVLEVEAGRGAAGNADYRDLIRTSLIVDAITSCSA